MASEKKINMVMLTDDDGRQVMAIPHGTICVRSAKKLNPYWIHGSIEN